MQDFLKDIDEYLPTPKFEEEKKQNQEDQFFMSPHSDSGGNQLEIQSHNQQQQTSIENQQDEALYDELNKLKKAF